MTKCGVLFEVRTECLIFRRASASKGLPVRSHTHMNSFLAKFYAVYIHKTPKSYFYSMRSIAPLYPTYCKGIFFAWSNAYTCYTISLRWHYCSFAFELAISWLCSSAGVRLLLPTIFSLIRLNESVLEASTVRAVECPGGGMINHPLNGNTEHVDGHSIGRLWNWFICHDLVVHNTIWAMSSKSALFSVRSETRQEWVTLGRQLWTEQSHCLLETGLHTLTKQRINLFFCGL
jgi:hypothetical protein